jgi:futalosine hydrolase
MIYILLPTHNELLPLLGLMDGLSEDKTGLRRSFSGTLHGHTVAAIISGVGQANTAQTLTAILEAGAASMVIMGGSAGAYAKSGLTVGDVAVATEEVYADLGVITPKGWNKMEETGMSLLERDGRRYFNRFPTSFGQYEGAIKAVAASGLRSAPGGQGRQPAVSYGPFLSVSTISGTSARGDELFVRFRALCENMEGAAAAQVAALYGIPFIEVRGISNMVEDRDRDRWDIDTASYNCAKFIEGFIKNLR